MAMCECVCAKECANERVCDIFEKWWWCAISRIFKQHRGKNERPRKRKRKKKLFFFYFLLFFTIYVVYDKVIQHRDTHTYIYTLPPPPQRRGGRGGDCMSVCQWCEVDTKKTEENKIVFNWSNCFGIFLCRNYIDIGRIIFSTENISFDYHIFNVWNTKLFSIFIIEKFTHQQRIHYGNSTNHLHICWCFLCGNCYSNPFTLYLSFHFCGKCCCCFFCCAFTLILVSVKSNLMIQ